MPQSAPLQWVISFFVFIYFAHLVGSKVWILSVSTTFSFPTPKSESVLAWGWDM